MSKLSQFLKFFVVGVITLFLWGCDGGTTEIVQQSSDSDSTNSTSSSTGVPSSIALTAPSLTISADSSTSVVITATVTDSSGTAVSGQNITFTRSVETPGSISNSADTNALLRVVEITSDSNGQATVTLTGDGVIGTSIIEATVGSISQTISINLVAGNPATLSLSSSPTSVNPSGESIISAIVRDSFGILVPGEAISFRVTTDNSGAPNTILGNSLTNSAGVATVDYVAGSTAGTDTITASSVSLTTLSNTLDIDVSSSASIGIASSISLGTTQTAVATGDDGDIATISANILDGNNAGIEGIEVSFSATGGQLSSAKVVSDANGVASVNFSAGAIDYSNHVVSITASVPSVNGGLTHQIPIQVSGTTISMVADQTSISEDGSEVVDIEISAKDSTSQAIYDATVCVEVDASISTGSLNLLDAGNSTALTTPCTIAGISGVLASATGKSGVDGRINIKVSGSSSGTAVLKAYALGTQASSNFIISPAANVFRVSSPVKDPIETHEVNNPHTITVSAPGVTTVIFASSLGTWVANGEPIIEVAVVGGVATAQLNSTVAGIAQIQVQEVGDILKSDSIQVAFTAPLASASKLVFQSSPGVLPASRDESVQYTSGLVARVLTADDQPVAGAVVNFTLVNPTGGGENIFPPMVVTDIAGEAHSTFTSGAQATSANGVEIVAAVVGTNLNSSFKIVITDEAGSVVIGRATEVQSSDETTYALPMSVLVADVNGNPVSNAEISLSVWPEYYFTGIRDFIDANNIDNGTAIYTEQYGNEDINGNNILDPGEDLDGNGSITPANSVGGTLPSKVITDERGVANFNLTYLKENAQWVSDRIRASTLVGGSQIVSELRLTLPAANLDVYGFSTLGGDSGGAVSDLPDSPFNATCSSDVTASSRKVFVPAGGTTDVILTVTDSSGNPLANRRVTGLVDSNQLSGTLNAIATGGTTDVNGQVTSSISASSLDAQDGDFATIYYFGSCAATVVEMVVGEPQGTPTQMSYSISPSTVAAGDKVDLDVVILDVNNLPVSGKSVTFSITDAGGNGANNTQGTLTQSSGITDDSGRVRISNSTFADLPSYVVGSIAGIDSITATETSSGITQTATVTMDPAVTAIQSVTLTPDQFDKATLAVGGDTRIIRASVLTTGFDPAVGVSVGFETSGGTFANGLDAQTVDTNINGVAEVVLTSSTNRGQVSVTASSGGVSEITNIEFVSGKVNTLTMTASEGTIAPGGSVLVSVLAQDSLFNPVSGEFVSFSVTTNSSTGELQSVSEVSDVNGRVSVEYRAGSPLVSLVTDTIQAEVANINVAAQTVNINVDPGAIIIQGVDLEVGSNSIIANNSDQTLIRAKLTDQSGTGIEGTRVELRTTLGTLLENDATTNYDPSKSYLTDSRGYVTFYVRSGQVLGEATITATAGGFVSSKSVSFRADVPAAMVINATPASVDLGESSTINVLLTDSLGNPVESEPLRFEISTDSSGATIGAATGTTDVNGRHSFSYSAGNSTGTDVITVTATSNGFSATVNLNVDVGAGGTGTPESVVIKVVDSQISVAGVGQDENTTINIEVLDGAGNKVDDPGTCSDGASLNKTACEANTETWTPYNNVRLSFTSSPNSGEVFGGVDKSGVAIDPPSNPIYIITLNGITTASLQSGTVSGVVEFRVDVLDADETTVLVSSLVSQVVIASGPAHAVNLTSPNSNSIFDLTGGVYRRVGKAVVTDRYGNSVPDGTVVNLGVLDSILASDNDAGLTASSATFTDADALVSNRRQTNVGLDAVSIVRNEVERFIEANDRVLITDADAEDKSRVVKRDSLSGNPETLTAGTSVTNKIYVNTAVGLNYVIGASMLGSQVVGEVYDDAGVISEVTGVAETKDGIATFYVVYPSNEDRIRIGCGIQGFACDSFNANGIFPQTVQTCSDLNSDGADDDSDGDANQFTSNNWVSYRDERFIPSDSAEVYVVASASESVTDSAVTIDQGQFCFSSIAGWSMEIAPSALSGSGRVTLTLKDGGDGVYLPFVGIGATSVVTKQGTGCFNGVNFLLDVGKGPCEDSDEDDTNGLTPLGVWRKSDFGLNLTDASCITDNPGQFSSGDGVSGTCSGHVEVTGSYIVTGDSATITWQAGDAEASVTLTIP